MSKVLFLCTGNYYRSRFAEIFFNWHAERASMKWRAFSRGLALDPNNPGQMSRHTLRRLGDLQIDPAPYLRFPLPATVEDFEAADHVVAIKELEHRPIIAAQFPNWLERTEYWGVHDLDCAAPNEAFPHLEQETLALLDRLSSL